MSLESSLYELDSQGLLLEPTVPEVKASPTYEEFLKETSDGRLQSMKDELVESMKYLVDNNCLCESDIEDRYHDIDGFRDDIAYRVMRITLSQETIESNNSSLLADKDKMLPINREFARRGLQLETAMDEENAKYENSIAKHVEVYGRISKDAANFVNKSNEYKDEPPIPGNVSRNNNEAKFPWERLPPSLPRGQKRKGFSKKLNFSPMETFKRYDYGDKDASEEY